MIGIARIILNAGEPSPGVVLCAANQNSNTCQWQVYHNLRVDCPTKEGKTDEDTAVSDLAKVRNRELVPFS